MIILLEDDDRHDICSVYLSALGKGITNADADKIWERLPDNIKSDALAWGTDDSVFRDNLYSYLEDNPNII